MCLLSRGDRCTLSHLLCLCVALVLSSPRYAFGGWWWWAGVFWGMRCLREWVVCGSPGVLTWRGWALRRPPTGTAAYEDPGCRRTGSVCSGPSGRTAQGSTSSGKHARAPTNNPLPKTSHSPKYICPPPPPTKSRARRRKHKGAAETEKGGKGTPVPPWEKDTFISI